MNAFAPERGDIAIVLDRPRFLRFDSKATWLLIQRYGNRFARALYKANSENELELVDMDTLVVFLTIGLQADARGRGEVLTHEQVESMVFAYNTATVFHAVVASLSGQVSTPSLGKARPTGNAAKPAGNPSAAPGPTKSLILRQPSGSPSRRSGGPAKPSGRRRSAN